MPKANPTPPLPDSAEPSKELGLLAALREMGPQTGLFALLCLATFFEGFDTKLASFILPVIREDFGASLAEVGTAMGISSFGMVLAFFVILLADTIGRRPIFLAGLFAYAVFTLATAVAPNLAVFTGLQFFGRMAMVVELGIAYLILSEEMPPHIRGRVNGLFGATAVLGAGVPAFFLAPLEAAGIGWRGLFVIGAIPLLLFPFYMQRIKETAAYHERPAQSGRYGEDFMRSARVLWHSDRRGRLIRTSLLWIAINFWTGAAVYFFTNYVYSERGWTAADLQLLPLGTIPFGIAGYVLSGLAMDRLGRRTSAAIYLFAAFFATALCFTSSDDRIIYFAYFLVIAVGGIWTIATTWTLELFPTESRATALAISNNLIGRMGLVFGPIASGMLSTAWGSVSYAILALSTVTLLALPIVWTLPETNAISLRGDAE